MAQIYSPPKEVGAAPEFKVSEDYRSYSKRQEAWVNAIVKWAKDSGNSELRGEEIRFPVGDGYARYIVFSLKPVKLIHLPVGDAWQFPYAKRLTAKDIAEEVRRNKAMEKLFSK